MTLWDRSILGNSWQLNRDAIDVDVTVLESNSLWTWPRGRVDDEFLMKRCCPESCKIYAKVNLFFELFSILRWLLFYYFFLFIYIETQTVTDRDTERHRQHLWPLIGTYGTCLVLACYWNLFFLEINKTWIRRIDWSGIYLTWIQLIRV